jgi:hypothetical protein
VSAKLLMTASTVARRSLATNPRRSFQELIAILNKEYRWNTNESAATTNLYMRRDKFVHTQPDRLTIVPVT